MGSKTKSALIFAAGIGLGAASVCLYRKLCGKDNSICIRRMFDSKEEREGEEENDDTEVIIEGVCQGEDIESGD